MTTNGPHDFTPGMLVGGVYIDGRQMFGGMHYPIADWSFEGVGPERLEMESGNTVLQLRWLSGDAPLNLKPIGFGVSFDVIGQDDFSWIQRRAMRQVAIPFWWDFEIPETWYIPGRYATTQTRWKTGRLLPWNLSGVSHVTRPPRVYLDDVAQTIITTGTPATGEILVPETGGDYADIISPALGSATWLELIYRPQILATIHGLQYAYRNTNVLSCSFEVHEHLANIYTVG